jgi:hypothetical protein
MKILFDLRPTNFIERFVRQNGLVWGAAVAQR